ncbi:MAG: hypothetical protein RMI91_09820, partial [Gemmatales bacterium]|nr:hypothetical protein [Gemmatales bacterium]
LGGIIRGLASAADPDDYGGTQVVAAVAAPGNRVFLYSGAPTTDAATLLRNTRELGNGTHSLRLKSPAGDLSHLPREARFCGEDGVNWKVSMWKQLRPAPKPGPIIQVRQSTSLMLAIRAEMRRPRATRIVVAHFFIPSQLSPQAAPGNAL